MNGGTFRIRRFAAAVLACAALMTLCGAAWIGTHQGGNGHGDNRIAFVVAGIAEPMTAWQTALAKATSLAPPGTPAQTIRSQVFLEARRGLAVLHEAQAKGLSVGDKEVDALLAQQRQMVMSSADGAARVEAFARAQGVSLDQYWSQARSGIAQSLLVNKLRDAYTRGHGGSQTDVETGWQRYEDALAAKAPVEMRDARIVVQE